MSKHGLCHEGAPYDDAGNRIGYGRHGGVGGEGRAKCACGALSVVLPSANQRRAWHSAPQHGVGLLPELVAVALAPVSPVRCAEADGGSPAPHALAAPPEWVQRGEWPRFVHDLRAALASAGPVEPSPAAEEARP